MQKNNAVRLDVRKFGEHLINSKDLDPIYVVLNEMTLKTTALHQWLIAYWCFYNAGVASFMSEQTEGNFWSVMETAARNVEPAPHGGRWERGKERRHFRGEQGIKAVLELKERFPDHPSDMVEELIEWVDQRTEELSGPVPFSEFAEQVKEFRGFGSWISFKVGDMFERILHKPIHFSLEEAMYEEPTKAAIMVFDAEIKTSLESGSTYATYIEDPYKVKKAVDFLQEYFGNWNAPGGRPRPIGMQEIETILCKWKSHMGGHYPLNNDLVEIHEGVLPWAKAGCPTAHRFASILESICKS